MSKSDTESAEEEKVCKHWGPITFKRKQFKEEEIGSMKKVSGLFVSLHGKSPYGIIKIKDEKVFIHSQDNIVIPAFSMDKFMPCKWRIPWNKVAREDRETFRKYYYKDLSNFTQKQREVTHTCTEFQPNYPCLATS